MEQPGQVVGWVVERRDDVRPGKWHWRACSRVFTCRGAAEQFKRMAELHQPQSAFCVEERRAGVDASRVGM